MPSTTQFRVNRPSVISETIDGEAIIVNLDSGAYYSLRDTAGVIWGLIEKGRDCGQIVGQFDNGTQTSLATLEESIDLFLAELEAEDLIIPLPQDTPAQENDDTPSEKLVFQTPIIEKFTDMADLLLLDPIHEVDEMGGWPHPAAQDTR